MGGENLSMSARRAGVRSDRGAPFSSGNFIQQLFLDPFFQRDVNHRATVTTAAKLQRIA